MALPKKAALLIHLALQAKDLYSAAAVYELATDEDKNKLEHLMFAKRQQALYLAKWEHTPAAVLEALLIKATDYMLVARLDKNQNTSASTLYNHYFNQHERLCSPINLIALIAQHPVTPLSVLKHIAQNEDDKASILALSKHAVANNEVFSILLKRFAGTDLELTLQKNIAENPSTSTALLEEMYAYEDVYIKAAILAHKHCSQQIYYQALAEKNLLILRNLALNKWLEDSISKQLSQHHDNAVRSGIAANQATSSAVIKELARDSCVAVRRAVASRMDLSKACITYLANDQDYWVRQRLARNPTVSARILLRLSEDAKADVRRGVARNVRCSANLLKRLARDEHAWVRSAVAYQPRTSKRVLEALAGDDALDVVSGVANNQNTPQRLLKTLTNSAEADVRRGVILNKQAMRKTLLPLLEDDYYLHRLMLIANHQLLDLDKWPLCFDPNDQVRFVAFRYFANQYIKK